MARTKQEISTVDLVEAQMKDFKPIIPITAQAVVEEYERKINVGNSTGKGKSFRIRVYAKTIIRLKLVNSLLFYFGEKKITADDILNKWLDKNLKRYSPKVYKYISRLPEFSNGEPETDETNSEEESWIGEGV